MRALLGFFFSILPAQKGVLSTEPYISLISLQFVPAGTEGRSSKDWNSSRAIL